MARGRVPLLVLLGTLLLQAAWIVAVPPYRGSDEFDHVYRAASVAHGYWRPDSQPAPNGRGGLIPVPRQIVTDGTEVCSSYEYTKPDNCNPVQKLDEDMVTVASAAQLYNPLYYAAVGWPSLFLDGATALYAMRVVSALLCALVITLAAWSVTAWCTSQWPTVGLVLALTPVTVYSSIVVAPNALGDRRRTLRLVGTDRPVTPDGQELGPPGRSVDGRSVTSGCDSSLGPTVAWVGSGDGCIGIRDLPCLHRAAHSPRG